MILTKNELPLVKAALAIVDADAALGSHTNVIITLSTAGRGLVTVDISSGSIILKAVHFDSSPTYEHYRSPMGMAMAYKVSLPAITNQSEGS